MNLDEMSTPDLAALVKRKREELAALREQPEPATDATALTAVASDT